MGAVIAWTSSWTFGTSWKPASPQASAPASLAYHERHAEGQQDEPDDPVQRDRRAGHAEQPEAVDDHRDQKLPRDHDRGQTARAEGPHGFQCDEHIHGAQQTADERPPGNPADLP